MGPYEDIPCQKRETCGAKGGKKCEQARQLSTLAHMDTGATAANQVTSADAVATKACLSSPPLSTPPLGTTPFPTRKPCSRWPAANTAGEKRSSCALPVSPGPIVSAASSLTVKKSLPVSSPRRSQSFNKAIPLPANPLQPEHTNLDDHDRSDVHRPIQDTAEGEDVAPAVQLLSLRLLG